MVTQLRVKPPLKPFVFYKMDNNGFILKNDVKKILKPWTDVLEDIKAVLTKYVGKNLHSIYILTDSIRTEKLENSGKFVFFILTYQRTRLNWLNDYVQYLQEKFSFIKGISIKTDNVSNILKLPDYFKFNIITQFQCIWGNDISSELPKYKPGFNIAFETMKLINESEFWIKFIQNKKDEKETIKLLCTKVARILLLSAFEICMEKEKKYSRDEYTCYRTFVKYYPDKEILMRKILNLKNNPSSDYQEVNNLLTGMGRWLIAMANLINVENELKIYLENNFKPKNLQ